MSLNLLHLDSTTNVHQSIAFDRDICARLTCPLPIYYAWSTSRIAPPGPIVLAAYSKQGAKMAVSATMATPTQAEEDLFLAQVLRLRDAVVAGKHAQIKLPPTAIEQLKASSVRPGQNGTRDAPALTAMDHRPPPTAAVTSTANGLLASSSGLDPIFLQKSPNLVRAEGMMKRQRIERELELQVEQRKHSARERDSAHEGHIFNVNAILLGALGRVKPVSGLQPAPQPSSSAASSFDENEYYSSQVQSDWSSDASSSKGSDREAGASHADVPHRTPYAHSSFAESSHANPAAIENHYTDAPEAMQVDEDDEYTPPDATAFEISRRFSTAINIEQPIPLNNDDDDGEVDDDEYEPGEITQGSVASTPYVSIVQAAPLLAHAPFIRNNHLTHIAAPQPNRVSPLATAKGPNIQLELVNGRPEVVNRMPAHRAPPHSHSRASTASPTSNGGVLSKKERKKAKQKRKRQSDQDVGRDTSAKKRREQPASAQSPFTPSRTEPHIKPEPISPPLQQVMEAPAYHPQTGQYRGNEIDLVSPQRKASQPQYVSHAPMSSLRHEYTPMGPGAGRLTSPAGHHPAKRDTQDLRRVASLHHAQRVSSPGQPTYSPPAPYRAVSHTYGQYLPPPPLSAAAEIDDGSGYREVHLQPRVQYVRTERPRSLSRPQEYQETYQSRGPSPALMPPPPPRKIIMDQFGQRYYAAEPVPEPARPSIAPIERRAQPDVMYEPRAASRAAYAAAYEPIDSGLAFPPAPLPRQTSDRTIDMLDPGSHRYAEYTSRPTETLRHGEAATPAIYQQVSQFEPMPPPQAPPVRQQASPIYMPTRTYSVRPDETRPQLQHQVPPNYFRQVSVAPPQYIRQDAPPPPATRATSVLPGVEYGSSSRNYNYASAYAPQQVTYVDQHGREVYPREVRQASEYRYQQ